MDRFATRNGLKLASFDGGGISSLSQLKVMQLLMHRVRCEAGTDDQHKVIPCEYFDLIGGSDTGGLIAIMFVNLRMSVEEAIEEFAIIVNSVYVKGLQAAERTSKFRECMESLLNRKGLPLDLKLEDESTRGRCIGFVASTLRLNLRIKVCLRTYSVKSALPSDIKVIDAALATCASQPEFLPLPFGAWFERQEYVGAGLGENNPVRQVVSEAHTYYGHQPVTLLLSFGSGHPGILSLSPDNTDDSLYQLMRKILQDSEQEAQAFQQDMAEARYYFRFSVEHGMERDHETHVGETSWIVAQTLGYLSSPETKKKIHKCIEKMVLSGQSRSHNQSPSVTTHHQAGKPTITAEQVHAIDLEQITEVAVDRPPDVEAPRFRGSKEDNWQVVKNSGNKEAMKDQPCGYSEDECRVVKPPPVEKPLPEPPEPPSLPPFNNYESRGMPGQASESARNGYHNDGGHSPAPFHAHHKPRKAHGARQLTELAETIVNRVLGQPEHSISELLEGNLVLQGAIV